MSTPLSAPPTDPAGPTTASASAAEYDRIADVFRPIIDRIAADAVEREELRLLPFEEVGWLKEAGFGALRVPVEYGGWGVSLADLVRLLIEIAAADSNVPQLLRGHIAFVETQRALPDTPQRREWFETIADRRILFGNAQAERSGTSATSTTLEQRDGRLVLNGRKYYSTGTLFADWIWSAARWDDAPVALAVPARADGVARIDDWDGFGQRLTGSGTTVFDDVEVDPRHVLPFDESAEHRPLAYTSGLYQLVLLASLAGIARAAEREAVAFVRPRTRTFGVAGESVPRADPLVQSVVGRVASARFAAESIVLEAARRLEEADLARRFDDSDAGRYEAALIAVFEAQQTVIDLVLRATTDLFEVGGASATSTSLRLDRLWRNARTIASHNPAIQRAAQIGAYHLDGTPPQAGPPRAPRA
ncbi:alkylation response protein AidB-like acyl-CoA dehydrogenase [Diaminobutyricimonas aerilata]|uniref:Alkylation response protein AidB-like acyl-CoA dehydrogenase n=1 Tax=Diaminobutyricimonas aerilata TaxID=1162967 RepID=A0A2M9CHM6_9MICO|nr:acyl-CoA dehydrogenase family protein [Diaminobutyricimonas aerilata]PJJ71426.1 alkylation response protein AidB-like acyl-CoA dehydrogenase [Diaminobutyricimonas aerilata]